MSEKGQHSDSPLTSRRTDGGNNNNPDGSLNSRSTDGAKKTLKKWRQF